MGEELVEEERTMVSAVRGNTALERDTSRVGIKWGISIMEMKYSSNAIVQGLI